MIDLTSTQGNADPQTVACARLLTSVIVQAIRDASEPLSAEERKACTNHHSHARMALRFLFDTESIVFAAYAKAVGSSADAIRLGLLTPSNEENRSYSQARRNALIARHAFWRVQYDRARPAANDTQLVRVA